MLPCQLRLELEPVGSVQWLWDLKQDAHVKNYTESKLWRSGVPQSNKRGNHKLRHWSVS